MPTIIIVRHGEVFNPNHVVYADLSGFDLSPVGVLQAHELGKHLASVPIDIIITSPLARARHTATAIQRHHEHIEMHVDDRLTETHMYPEWTGQQWEDIERRYPEQLRGYLEDPTALSDVSESVFELFARVSSCTDDAIDAGHRTIVVVGHQDPSQALRLGLVGRPLSELAVDPPKHASATTLLMHEHGARFEEVSSWHPAIANT